MHAAFSIAVSAKYVVCACSEGTIRLFEPGTLQYRGILPKPHPLGMDISAISSPDMIASLGTDLHYPDVVSLAYDGRTDRVTAVYSDRSMFLWDIRDMKRIGKYRSFIYHSDCIWGMEVRQGNTSNHCLINLNFLLFMDSLVPQTTITTMTHTPPLPLPLHYLPTHLPHVQPMALFVFGT